MKIISPTRSAHKSLDRNQFLDLEIERLQEEIGVKERIGIPLPIHLKAQYLALLENFTHVHAKLKNVEEETILYQSLQAHEFTCFRHLPTELRLKIWGLSFAPDTQPRVHCIKIVNSDTDRENFISNQLVSPILHANHESRSHYLSNIQSVFAFDTYINFDTDIVYIPYIDHRILEFGKFLEFNDTKMIQKLAMRKDLFCNIPLPGHFAQKHVAMMQSLYAWKEMTIVFEDRRQPARAWKDTAVTFKEFSARQKRQRAERSYVRQHTKTLNDFMEDFEERIIHFRFGRLERGPTYAGTCSLLSDP